MAHSGTPSNLYGLVDMGSNGIRFSISDMTPPARALPTVIQDRSGTSLYDAQYSNGEKGPIPQQTINDVLASLARFKTTCTDFGVPETNIKFIATEATRTAENSVDFRRQIKDATGWEVDMLPKEAEGRIGALGVASSFDEVEGLVMDLGGGSTQITWMISKDGKVETCPTGSISFPYGAAAMTRRLAEIDQLPKVAEEELKQEMLRNFRQAIKDLQIPKHLQEQAKKKGGYTLYLSGGGFRGWGYLLMSQHKTSPYPVPIINGFQVNKYDFHNTMAVTATAASSSVFRISNRRAAQVPAVAFLVNVLIDALPVVREIRFCQGGVREGFLFDTLSPNIKAMHPLPASSARYACASAPAFADLLMAAIPTNGAELDCRVPGSLTRPLIRALADLLVHHSSLPKESTSLAALYTPLTGVLACAHGVSHKDRALLALMLAQRWDAEIPPPHDGLQNRLRALLTRQEVWWCSYVGAVAKLVGDVYPAGVIRKERIGVVSARWMAGLGKKGMMDGVRLVVRVREEGEAMTERGVLREAVERVERVGKKKNWVVCREGYGVPVSVGIERVEGDW